MDPNNTFNKKIKSYLTDQPTSSASDTIRLIQTHMKRKIGFYEMFDEFAYKLGIGISATGFLNDKDKLVGYIPYIFYYPNNLVNEEPKHDLLNDGSHLKLDKCYEILAKGLLYRIQRIPNIVEIIKDLR